MTELLQFANFEKIRAANKLTIIIKKLGGVHIEYLPYNSPYAIAHKYDIKYIFGDNCKCNTKETCYCRMIIISGGYLYRGDTITYINCYTKEYKPFNSTDEFIAFLHEEFPIQKLVNRI